MFPLWRRTPSRRQRSLHFRLEQGSPFAPLTPGARPPPKSGVGSFTTENVAAFSWQPIWHRFDKPDSREPTCNSTRHLTALDSEEVPIFPDRFKLPRKNLWHDKSHAFRHLAVSTPPLGASVESLESLRKASSNRLRALVTSPG